MIKPSHVATTIAILGLLIALYIQVDLAIDYAETTSGKTRTLFGIKHLFVLPWAGVGLLAIVVALYGKLRKEGWKKVLLPIGLGVLQMLLIRMELWWLLNGYIE